MQGFGYERRKMKFSWKLTKKRFDFYVIKMEFLRKAPINFVIFYEKHQIVFDIVDLHNFFT